MKRRTFIKYGAATVAAGALSNALPGSVFLPRAAHAQVTHNIDLTMAEATVELVDGSYVFMWAFANGTNPASVPGPVIRVAAGDTVNITVYNQTGTTHGFSIPGIDGSAAGPIASGAATTVSFVPTVAGSYFYLDPLNAPVNRVLGLHGALVVAPADGLTASQKPMPYGQAQVSPLVATLFDTLGGGAAFPGDPWDPARDMIWVFNQIDPSFNARAEAGQTIDPTTMLATFLPRYFTLNGLSGFYAAHDAATAPMGRVGQPMLLRTMNAGLATHSPHIHGNHIYELSSIDPDSGRPVVGTNPIQRDTWSMPPLYRKDVLLPFVRPGDVPDAVWPPTDEPFPMYYPMHCHTEMSQTAAGGNYPQGLIAHWAITGPLA